jgi:hypothetical protein
MRKTRKPGLGQDLPVPVEVIERRIYLVRSQKVMLDADLARLYQVPTKAFNQAVRRNLERFPEDFMFRLDSEEARHWRSHYVTSRSEHGGSRYLPFVFTEHGVAMLSSVLKSKRALQMNILIIRAFRKASRNVSHPPGLGKATCKAGGEPKTSCLGDQCSCRRDLRSQAVAGARPAANRI